MFKASVRHTGRHEPVFKFRREAKPEIAGRLDFVDPRKHDIVSAKSYTAWDLKGIETSDFVFAYLERNNPGGYSLALEVGYAKGLGKMVIYAEDPADDTDGRAKYLEMIRSSSDYCCASLDDGLKILQELLEQRLVR